MGVDFIIGDVTTLQADAVVNVINYELKDGGLVNYAIHRAAGPELKEYSGMNEYQVKMLTFAEKMVDVLKAKLGDSIGDAASAKIVEMLSWEMKAQRDNNY